MLTVGCYSMCLIHKLLPLYGSVFVFVFVVVVGVAVVVIVAVFFFFFLFFCFFCFSFRLPARVQIKLPWGHLFMDVAAGK